MKNDHRTYGRYVKVGYTQQTPDQRAFQLGLKYECKFEVLWALDVYDPERAEQVVHEFFHKCLVRYEFFAIDPKELMQFADNFFKEPWRETESHEGLPPSLVELAEMDCKGHLLEPDKETVEHEIDLLLHADGY